MKILYINNEPNSDHSKLHKYSRSFLPYYLSKKSNLLGIGKYELHKFYLKYLKFKPDIILSDWVPAGFIPVFLKKLGLIKCPIIHRWEDYYAETMTNYPYWLIKFMEDYTAKNADHLIVIHKTIYRIAPKINNSVFLLPYGVMLGNKKTKINLDKLKTKKSNLKVIYLGEINLPFKRVDKIIEAAKKNDCDLFLFGEEPNEKLKEMSKGYKTIHFMGWVDQDEVADVLRQGDILVNTADLDMSMKFLEYVNAGKPILALDGKPSEFFKHKETAYLTQDFEEGLRELIRNKNLRNRISKGMKTIKLYSWEEVADLHLELYKKIIFGGEDLDKFRESYYHVPL